MVNLEALSYVLERTLYESELFPAAVYRLDEPKVVILIFATGKLVVTGTKKEETIHHAVATLQQRLEERKLIVYT